MRQVNILLMIPSAIHMAGLNVMLRKLRSVKGVVTEIRPDNYTEILGHIQPSLIIADPIISSVDWDYLKGASSAPVKLVGLLSQQFPKEQLAIFDEVISIYDSEEKIVSTIDALLVKEKESDRSKELSPREKEVVTGIVKGLSNKEIADWMNVSVNTIMTHRRNIAAKLHIHTPAGLTIYAIVSGLVNLDDVRDDMDLTDF